MSIESIRETERDQIESRHRQTISATMAPIICGVSPWDSPYSLYCRMKGLTPPKAENFKMWMGKEMEPVVIRAFTRETGIKVSVPKRGFDPRFWYETEKYGYPMGCLLDGWAWYKNAAGKRVKAVVEAKTSSGWNADQWENDVPLHYWFQVQHQMAVTGWNLAYVPAILGGGQHIWHAVVRDDEAIEMMVNIEREFWEKHILANVPPNIDGSSATTDAIRARYDKADAEVLVYIEDEDMISLIRDYKEIGHIIKGYEESRDELRNKIIAGMGDAGAAIAGDYKVSAKVQTRSSLDTKALSADLPDVAEKYRRVTESRVLRVTEVKP